MRVHKHSLKKGARKPRIEVNGIPASALRAIKFPSISLRGASATCVILSKSQSRQHRSNGPMNVRMISNLISSDEPVCNERIIGIIK